MKLSLLNKDISSNEVYLLFRKLLELNASEKQIADIAFEYHNLWHGSSENAYNAIYDLALLGEEGFDNLHREQIKGIIENIMDSNMSAILEHVRIMKTFLLNENISSNEVYLLFKKLLELNASDKQIADIALEYHNSWSNLSKNANDAICELSLLGEEGFELTKSQVNEIIERIIL